MIDWAHCVYRRILMHTWIWLCMRTVHGYVWSPFARFSCKYTIKGDGYSHVPTDTVIFRSGPGRICGLGVPISEFPALKTLQESSGLKVYHTKIILHARLIRVEMLVFVNTTFIEININQCIVPIIHTPRFQMYSTVPNFLCDDKL